MEKKVSEMNFEERFSAFKEGILELVHMHFNGERHELPPVVFLGVKHTALTKVLQDPKIKNVEAFGSDDSQESINEMLKNKQANPEHIHIVPIEIANMLAAGEFTSQIFGPHALEKAKDMAREQIDFHINLFNKHEPNGVQFTAHVSEAFVGKGKMSKEEQYKFDTEGKQPKQMDDLDKMLEEGKRVRDLPGVEEKVLVLFETIQFSEMDLFDMIRGEEYQELGKCDTQRMTTPPGGIFGGLIHKSNIVN